MLITERDRIDHSHSIADSVLETAYATRTEFGRQRQTLARLNQRLMQSASAFSFSMKLTIGQIPGINTLIGKINTRKKRDSVILAGLISLCVFGLLIFR
jgi:Golgi SNAP receptor complex protein 1